MPPMTTATSKATMIQTSRSDPVRMVTSIKRRLSQTISRPSPT